MKANAIFRNSIFVLILLSLSGLKGVSQNVTDIRETGSFRGVEASGIFTVYLTQADEFSVIIEAREDIIADIETYVSKDMLKINFRGRSRDIGEMKAYVSAPEITRIVGSGATSFYGETLLQTEELTIIGSGASSFSLEVDVDMLTSRLSGATNATYSGRASTHYLNVSGASFARASELATETTDATASGASTARVKASSFLKATASGTSGVLYYQRPESQEFRTTGMSSIKGVNGDGAEVNDDQRYRIRMGDHEVRFRERRKRTFRGNWGGLELGINGLVTPDGSLEMPAGYEFMELRYERAIAVNLNLFQQDFALISNNVGLVTGIGFTWNNYRLDPEVIPVRVPNDIDVAEPNPDFNYRRSKLAVWYLNVPLLVEFQTGARRSNQFHFGGGVITGLRLRTHTKQVYLINGTRNRDKTFDDFHMRPFRFDATARVGWGRINLFANYSLNTLFRDERGPEVHPFTVGMRVISW
jgi:hypothetical protein